MMENFFFLKEIQTYAKKEHAERVYAKLMVRGKWKLAKKIALKYRIAETERDDAILAMQLVNALWENNKSMENVTPMKSRNPKFFDNGKHD